MDWVRIHPIVQNWPGGGPPPTFDISADENGSVVVELAWDPQALAAPSAGYVPLRYYTSGATANITYKEDKGASRTISIPAQDIQLSGNRAAWTIPQPLWDGYVQETLKMLNSPPKTTFAGNLYYRVRATAPAASQPKVWPSDVVFKNGNASAAPHIGILPLSGSPSSQVLPDQAAVAAVGGIHLMPTLWSDVLTSLWRSLPESDPGRQVLVRIFAHESFQSSDVATRAGLLKLWLLAGPKARLMIPKLLDRRTVIGSNVTTPVINKQDLRGGRTLVQNLLALLDITPHPDLRLITSKEYLVDDVITEILDPNGQVNQGAAGTCAPTSMQTLMITINPAEYARLQIGWLSAAGKATLANGAVSDIPAGVFKIANYATVPTAGFLMRTYSELAFQAAILKFAQGSRFPALTGTPENINNIFQATIKGGLFFGEMKKALDALFAINFKSHDVTFPVSAASQTDLAKALIKDLPMRQQQMVLATFWGPNIPAQPRGAHAVLGIRTDGGRLFFKNPQYAGSNPQPGIVQGGLATNPPRRYEDPSQSLESITDTDLRAWVLAYWVPDSVIL